MGESTATLHVQICYARPDRQILLELIVPSGCTIHQAINASGILREAPEIDISTIVSAFTAN